MEQVIPTAPTGKIFVQIEKTHNDTVKVGGVEFYQDTSFRPEWHTVVCGIVASIPRRIGDQFENQGIVPDVQVGDKLYFDWSVVHEKTNRVEYEGQDYWKVDYFQAICAIRNGEICPVGGRVIVTPLVEDKGDVWKGTSILLPEYSKSQTSKEMGTLVAKGQSKLTEEPLLAEVGDTVIFPDWAINTHNIEGKDYYIIEQEHILGKI